MSKSFPHTEPPEAGKTGLIAALKDTGQALRTSAETLSPDLFFQSPSEDRWSAAEHTSHLITSVKAVAGGLAYAKWLVRLKFGKAKGKRTYPELVAFYQSKLSDGVKASGRYVPTVEPPASGAEEAERRELLDRWDRAVDRLVGNMESWSEKHLDTLQFPHPVLGNLTVREMLFFTHYHNLHHISRMAEIRSDTP